MNNRATPTDETIDVPTTLLLNAAKEEIRREGNYDINCTVGGKRDRVDIEEYGRWELLDEYDFELTGTERVGEDNEDLSIEFNGGTKITGSRLVSGRTFTHPAEYESFTVVLLAVLIYRMYADGTETATLEVEGEML